MRPVSRRILLALFVLLTSDFWPLTSALAANVFWRGTAAAVSQVDTLTVGGTIEIGDKFKCTINGKTLSVSATTTSTSTTASEIATAWNALAATTNPEHAEITAAANASTVTLTADTKGKPFTCTVVTTESDDSAADAQTFSTAATTASAGPNHWDTAGNWSTGAVPVNSDNVYVENSSISILYGLSQSSVTLTSLNVAANYTGRIGLAQINSDTANTYQEYRTAYLTISATTLNVGDGTGNGSGRLKFNVGTNACTLNVYLTGSAAETGIESLLWKGTHASNIVNVNKGSVGIGVLDAESATVATLRVGYTTTQASDSTVRCGTGVTLTTVEQLGGVLTTASNCTTITQVSGKHTHSAGTVTTVNLDGGELYYTSTGTITTANVSSGGILDFGRDQQARTVTNCNLTAGATLKDPGGKVTFTNGIDLERCSISDVTVDVGSHRRLTPGTPS